MSQLHRRDFLVLGTAAAATLTATGLRSDILRTTPMPFLGIGYADGDRLVDATRVSGDATLAENGARVTVLGFNRADAHRAKPLTISVRAHYPVVDPSTRESVALHAWKWRSDVDGVSARSPFHIPFEKTLALSIEREGNVMPVHVARGVRGMFQPRAERSLTAFAPRAGRYFLAVRENEADRAPSWSSLRIAEGTNELHGSFGAADFSYLVISIA